MTPDEAFKLAVRSLDRAIDLIQKWQNGAKVVNAVKRTRDAAAFDALAGRCL